VPAVLAVAVLASACGGSSGAGGEGVATAGGTGTANPATDGSPSKDPQQAGLDFARCMREQGVDMPDPEVGERGMVMVGPRRAEGEPGGDQRPPAGFEEAHRACAHFLEDMIQDDHAKPDPAEQDRALEFARCMRENGVDMPDPDFSDGGAGFSIQIGEEGFDPTSETFKAAQKACGSLFGPEGGAPAVAARGGATS